MIIEHSLYEDIKLRLAFVINGQRVNPDLIPFDIKIWTLYPNKNKTASYDGDNWVNCLMREDYLEVILNAPQFNTGRLNVDITLHYPDDDFPDKIRDKIVKVRLDNPLVNPDTNDVIITGEVSDTIAGLSAYGVAVWNGFEGTEEEWLQSLKQPAIDAAAEAEALMEDFALQELARANEENTRKQSELARIAEEQNRVNQELARVDEENTRKQSELARIAEEQNRVNQELARVDEENTRKQSELARIAEEQNRVNQELARANEENTRKQSELARIAEEQNRVNQELARVDEENTRQSQEQARQNTIAGLGDSFDTKIDKTAIKQTLGTSPTDVMSQKAITEAIMKAHDYDINFFAYGVSRDLTGTGQALPRVGNLSLHKTRPILRKSRGCVKNAQGVQYYLDNNTDFLKADGVTPSVLDGTDGDVMTEIPEMYVYEYTENNIEYTYISEFPLPNFKRIPKTYHGRYEGSYDTTTNQLRSVINPNIRSGLPATGQSVFYYNSGAIKDRNLDWSPDRLLSHYVRELLFRVHYSTYNSQAQYNSALTPEGYLQGGLGVGVTNINGTKWSKYNGYNPFIPCGYTAELGNRTGVKDFYMPFEYDGFNTTTGDNTQYYKGVYNASTDYSVNELVADMVDSVIGKGDGKLYKCILNAPAGTALTNTTYFTLQTRTVVQTNRFIGIEQPFGHTFKQTIDAIVELTDNYTTTKCYVYDNPAHFASTKTENARFLCDMPSQEGYIKLFNQYTIVPYSIGGSSGSWGYDYYYWRGEAGGALRGLLFGGGAVYWSLAGLGCSYSNYSPSSASANVGVRLCCFSEGSKIE